MNRNENLRNWWKLIDLYYVTIFQQQSLSGEIEHGCVLIQSKMRKWFPMHTLL